MRSGSESNEPSAVEARGLTHRTIRELGKRSLRTFAAIREPRELVVVQRFVRVRADAAQTSTDGATLLGAEPLALLMRDARCLAKSWHPNIGRVRSAELSPGGELTIACELLEGATLGDLVLAAAPDRVDPRDPALPLPVLVRVFLDVLAGLHALHSLRDGMNVPLAPIHGELCPANVIVGRDGVARIVNALRPRPVRLAVGSEAMGYAAPEAIDGSGTDDPRADVYAVGVMLWEGLTGRRLFAETDPALVLAKQREGELAAPPIHPSSPFARLSDVAMRALSFDAALRFKNANEMAAELRKIAGARLASGSAVAACAIDLAGEQIRKRRSVFEAMVSGSGTRPAAKPAKPATRLRASARKPAPTVEAFVPDALIEASRAADETTEEPAPSSRDFEPVITAKPHSPLTPSLPIPPSIDATEALIASALAMPTSQMRAVGALKSTAPPAPEQDEATGLSSTETPRDFVIPIDVTETLNEAAPRQRRSLAAIAFVAAVLLLAMGAFVAQRARHAPAAAASTVTAPPPAEDDTTAIVTTPVARAKATPPSSSVNAPPRPIVAPGPATPPAAAVSATTAASAVPAKPKKSIYDPAD